MPVTFPILSRYTVVEEWCDVRELEFELVPRILLCEGVRHALSLIFDVFARVRRRIAVPTDVYPVYWYIAARAGVDAVGIQTFPTFDLDGVLTRVTDAGAEVVLLPAPLVLHGRPWTEAEIARAIVWLRAASKRRLILDGTYSFGLPVDVPIKGLIETDQVIYLDSLSKGWLAELVLGVACVPRTDLSIFAESFQNLALSQQKLFVACELLRHFRRFPLRLAKDIDQRRFTLAARLGALGVRTLPATVQGYFLAIESRVSRLLDEHQLLTIPAAAFGSRCTEWSIASVLPAGNR